MTPNSFAFMRAWFGHTSILVAGSVLLTIAICLGMTMIMVPVAAVAGLVGVALLSGGLFVRVADLESAG
jgi:hypothetical protein